MPFLHCAKKCCFSVSFLLGPLGFTMAESSAGQLPEAAQAQIMRQTMAQAAVPAKVEFQSIAPARVGAKTQASIALLNADGQLVSAKEDGAYRILFESPSGDLKSQTVWIKQGQSTAAFEFVPERAGFTTISVKPLENRVRADNTQIIVQPAARSNAASRPRRSRGSPSRPPTSSRTPELVNPPTEARFLQVGFALPSGKSPAHLSAGTATPQPPTKPILHISVNDVGINYFANGKDGPVISVVYENPDLTPTPTAIHIWLSRSQGKLEPEQPLVIAKDAYSVNARLTSAYPADIHVSFVSSTPSYEVQGDKEFTVHFVPLGAVLVAPDRLSVVDVAPVMLVFYGADKQPVSPGKDWPVTLQCKHSRLKFTPKAFKVLASSPQGSTDVLPISFGTDTVSAVLANYTPDPVTIRITGLLVLILCVAGGAAGGAAAYSKFRGSWFWRIFLGIIAGALFCWLYIVLALPSIDNAVAHNTLSVFFIALLGGYLGLQRLDFAAKKFGWLH